MLMMRREKMVRDEDAMGLLACGSERACLSRQRSGTSGAGFGVRPLGEHEACQINMKLDRAVLPETPLQSVIVIADGGQISDHQLARPWSRAGSRFRIEMGPKGPGVALINVHQISCFKNAAVAFWVGHRFAEKRGVGDRGDAAH